MEKWYDCWPWNEGISNLIGSVIVAMIFLPIACILDHKYGT